LDIAFRTNKLEKCYCVHARAFRTWGLDVGRRYIQRINIIKAVRGMDDLYKMPELKCHPLKGDRKGQYAVSLTGFHRLIFTLQGERLEIVMVEEVSKHYDD
jgi:proteic killer suppression protein